MKSFICLLLLIPLFYFAEKFCLKQTDGFTLLKIQSSLPFHPEWETAPPLKELSSLLNQKFTYLSSGGQCYAFVSEDGKMVVKFFKHHLRRLPLVLAHLPLPSKYAALREKQRTTRSLKLLRDFTSYKLAHEMLSEECGLIYVHLNKTRNLKIALTIVDKLGIAHSLDLDNLEFIIQYKADLALEHFRRLIQEQKVEEGKRAIDSILSLIIYRCQKGIYDEDPRLHRNLGFIGEKAIFIDLGRLRKDPDRTSPIVYAQDLCSITYRLHDWLLKESPELAHYLQERLHAL